MVEHSAVNRRVVGSNPTRGVLKSVSQLLADFNFEKIKEDDFLDMGESSMLRYTIKPEVMQKYKTLIL